jgi:cytochrome c-type biogenesis protein CcmE
MINKKIIIIIIIAICAGIAFYSLFSTGRVLTPYVSFEAAMKSGEHVQVIGKADNSKPFEQKEGVFSFDLKESSDSIAGSGAFTMKVSYVGAKPNNFDNADQIVVQGSFSKENNIFEAKKILVKCPSKYIRK